MELNKHLKGLALEMWISL